MVFRDPPFRLRVRCIVCRQWPRRAENILLSHDLATWLRMDVVVCCGSHYCMARIERGDIAP